MGIFNKGGIAITEFNERQRIAGCILGRNEFVSTHVALAADLDKPVVIRSRHVHVDIIVPRDNAMMTHGTDASTSYAVVGEMMLIANTDKLAQNVCDNRIPLWMQD